MADAESPSFPKTCPHCGGPVLVLPVPGGQGKMAICSQCRQDLSAQDSAGESGGARGLPSESGSRIKNLLAASPEGGRPQAQEASPGVPPDKAGTPSPQQSAASARADVRQDLEASLRNQGFIVEDDGQNIRLRAVSGGGKGSGLSASDIVRLAAELEGGILPPERRVHCPKCDAVVPPGQAKCQWCGATIAPAG